MGKAIPYPRFEVRCFALVPAVGRRSVDQGLRDSARRSQLQGSGFYAPPYASPRFTRSWPLLP